jgi:hypothetical protein
MATQPASVIWFEIWVSDLARAEVVYAAVDDLNVAVTQARRLGATVVEEPRAIGTVDGMVRHGRGPRWEPPWSMEPEARSSRREVLVGRVSLSSEGTPRMQELAVILESSAWFGQILDAAAAVQMPECWVGAGVVRDVVWDTRYGNGFDAGRVRMSTWPISTPLI